MSKIVRPAGYGHACDSFCCVWAHRTLLRVSFPHVLPMAMPNARNKNRARLQSFCAASDSKRTGRHSAFVSRNQTYALAFLALIGLHRRFPPMRYHSRDINRRRTTKSPHTAVSRPRSPLMVKSELLVPRYLANRSAYCRRPSPPLRSGFRVDIMPYPLDPVLPYPASTTNIR